MPAGGRAFLVLVRNLIFASVLYAAIYYPIEIGKSPQAYEKAKGQLLQKLASATKNAAGPQTSWDGQVQIGSPSLKKTVIINPHANGFNRPAASVEINDAYMGPRPHVDTVADIQMLVEECRGTEEGLEKMRDVSSCLDFLATREDRYYRLPASSDRASQQHPSRAEYMDADGHGNTLARYPDHISPSPSSPGECNGPILPYHVYWSGPATWRVEVFVKAYLHTQNLPCSRLWLWLDADRDPLAVRKFMTSDPIFARFLPLVDRGDIKVLSWNFPKRIPLPSGFDHTDGLGYHSRTQLPDAEGFHSIADGLIEDPDGQQYIELKETQMTFFAQAISDAVRFVILHLHGGLYLDMDVLMLRDMRPLLLPTDHNFAERWAAHPHPGDFNTAILSLSANSSLSSYLLRGGVRMGLNFHPRVMGRMAWKDGRDRELAMLETAAFDPIWTEFNGARQGRCTVPCLKDYSQVFKGTRNAIKGEWDSVKGQNESTRHDRRSIIPSAGAPVHVSVDETNEPLRSFATSKAEIEALKEAGVVADYREEVDYFPPSNRTLQNFFRGAWTYHVHNQWTKRPEPSSWLGAIQSAHDRYFGGGVNPYGEHWNGPDISPYNQWAEFL